ncbi:MAG: lamin tail domain-containing protein [Candidatus Thermoplasmatota archaeon]|nr:lamin tail domain-containing protein [Euryarchaeota archaeon]MBU4031693.1 lamin tail domain-containing protein [Candidatus Thermoplasmatota archaeon]MBU4071347.1 lamin tail domain-containing protein [Candidatus Thermoplasmatota archaeon]MBU4144623.1 lamin tail domain-containing protein [Candidatus Thermoplasmatota archaeon]MBU4592383.1 lamin tail domain-containing protein [Candidatus Thermoplasmatota archaeon]
MRPRKLSSDENARVPFAMVAVLILMLSVFSITYLGGIQRQQAGERIIGAEVSRQNSMMHQVEERMALEGFYIASRAVVASTQHLSNQSMLDACFSENYSAYLGDNFPLFVDPYNVEVRDFSSSVFLEEQGIWDLVPSNETQEQNITLIDGDGVETNSTVEVLDTVTTEQFNETTALARYVVVGYGNCTIRNVRSGAAMERPISFERRINSPFPLMDSKMQALETAAGTDTMGLARSIKYILTTLAQFRVLEGYGSGLDAAPGNTSEILTMTDVQLATNIAMLLETARLFRSYDASVIAKLETLGLGAESQNLRSLVDDYLNSGTLDPADIIALYTGLGTREIPVDIILAQAFNAIVDQFILKYLDYFGVMDIANAIYKSVQKCSQLIEDMKKTLTQMIWGDDGENRKEAEQISGWISNLATMYVWPPENTGRTDVVVGDDPASATDLAVFDVIQYVDGVYDYRANFTQLLAETSTPLLDTDGIHIGELRNANLELRNLSARTRSLEYLVDFLPVSIVRQSPDMVALWSTFYDSNYSTQQDVIYDTIRDAVKNITYEISGIITDFIGQKTLSLSGYADGKFAIDPKDKVSVLEGLKDMVSEVISDASDYLQENPGILDSMLAVLTDKQSRLTLDFMEFVSMNYDTVVDKTETLESAFVSLSDSVLSNSSISVVPVAQFSESYYIYNSIGHERGFTDDILPYDSAGLPDTALYVRMLSGQNTVQLHSDLDIHTGSAYDKLKTTEAAWYYFGSPDNGLYIKALEGTVSGMSDTILQRFIGQDPSALVGLAHDMVLNVLEGIIWGGEVSNTQYSPEIVYSDANVLLPFEMYEGTYASAVDTGNVWAESFSVRQPGGILSAIPSAPGMNTSNLPGSVLATGISEPTGVHYTDAVTFNERPFENRWNVTIAGTVRLHVSSSSMPYMGNGTHMPAVIEKDIVLNLDIPILAYSGWNLVGVNYTSTNDLAGDVGKLLDIIGDFFEWVWETIAGPINWIIDQIMMVVDFFADIIGTLLGYASDIMELITDLIGFLVETVQDFLRDIADSVLDYIVDWIIDLLPDDMTFRFSMFGFQFIVAFASADELDSASSGKGGKLMSIETEGMLLGAGLEIGLDLVVLSDEVAESVDVNYDLLLWSKVNISGFMLDTKIDPFMVLQEHIVECHGLGNGFALELFIPVVECYDSITYSLHDIPGVGAALSNIPIPFLGMKASVNAGLEILYTLRGIESDTVIINEVELNPRGLDRGNQWIELCNPTDSEISLDGWVLGSAKMPKLNQTFNSTMVLDPGSYFMIYYENITLPTEDFKLELIDPGGKKVDSTPLLSEPDSEFVGDVLIGPSGGQMTWQRSPNAVNLSMAGKWVFDNGTIGSENAAINISFKTLVWNLIKGAFNATWQNLKDQLALSLDFIVKLVTQFIQRFIDDVLRIVAKSVVETSLFLDVMLTDMTGSGGGGITLSFVIEGGETLAAILRWVIDSVSAFLAKFGKPNQPAQYPKLSADIPEHLFVRLDFYAMVQVPAMVKSAVQSQEDMGPIKLAGRIEANIPALAALAGKDMGQWRINFGVYVEKMPAAIADPLFGTGDATPDVWLFKGTVYEI